MDTKQKVYAEIVRINKTGENADPCDLLKFAEGDSAALNKVIAQLIDEGRITADALPSTGRDDCGEVISYMNLSAVRLD